ncbi:MAG: TerB family tellurite resistance protein, partial [Methylocapsa sp.]|nr:TerB family tellurite resistance protein [Methylocapsa sp.]
PGRGFDDEDYRLAAVALLVHVASADGPVDLRERRKLQAIIKERFGLDSHAAQRLTAAAEQSDREAVDFYHFTSVLKRMLDDAGRRKIVEMLWDIAFADGAADELEENTIWRIAELLAVSTRDRVLLRQKIAGQIKAEPGAGGPWSSPGGEERE